MKYSDNLKNAMKSRRVASKQLVKYLAVGALSNSLAYGLYLAITVVGWDPIPSMSIVYVVASATAFAANRGWTFQSEASFSRSGLRYIISQILGYATNLILLSGLYLVLDFPHQTAQLIGTAVVAVELFLLNRYYVFS